MLINAYRKRTLMEFTCNSYSRNTLSFLKSDKCDKLPFYAVKNVKVTCMAVLSLNTEFMSAF